MANVPNSNAEPGGRSSEASHAAPLDVIELQHARAEHSSAGALSSSAYKTGAADESQREQSDRATATSQPLGRLIAAVL